jgi:hypothetical protein
MGWTYTTNGRSKKALRKLLGKHELKEIGLRCELNFLGIRTGS